METPAVTLDLLAYEQYHARQLARIKDLASVRQTPDGLQVKIETSSGFIPEAWLKTLRFSVCTPAAGRVWTGETVDVGPQADGEITLTVAESDRVAPDLSRICPGSIIVLETPHKGLSTSRLVVPRLKAG